MTTCDVLIVGGGPAGAACAWQLRHSGLNVLILDRKTFPRDKTCAGWITPQVVEELQIDLDDYQAGRVLEPITGFGVALLGKPETEIHYGRTISYGIRRCEFDDYLLRRAQTRCELGQPLRTLERDNGGWIANGQIRAGLVVGAGGHFCPVARILSKPAARDPELVIAAREVEFEMTQEQLRDPPVPSGIPYFYFCTDLRGYGWYYRKGNYLNIGLGREDNQGLAGHVEEFCQYLKDHRRIPANIPSQFAGHAYMLYEHASRDIVGEGVLLIGDSAGLAYGQSGEGIRPAIESGLLAALVIREARGDYRRENLEPYRQRLQARLGKKSRTSILDFVPLGVKKLLAGSLLASRTFARRVVLDQWFLHRHEPALVVSGPVPDP
jgi:flavin-dependent dehydrogenase